MQKVQNDQQNTKKIYFEEVPLKQQRVQRSIQDQNIIIKNFDKQIKDQNIVQEAYNNFEILFDTILNSSPQKEEDLQLLCKSINQYTVCLVKFQKQQIFFQHAVQKKFIALLLKKMEDFKFGSDIVKTVFSALEFLLKAIQKQDQYVYLMVSINKEGFVTATYNFQEDDSAYFANFLKLLTRKINQDEKYLNIFFNIREPEFPLLLNLLKFHNSKDQILATSVKLTLIQICSNKSKAIKKFVSNFPFILFYPVYVYQIFNSFTDSISKDPIKSEEGIQNLKNSLKFMEDYIQNKDRQAIEMYTNCFMTLIGKFLYKQLLELSPKTSDKVIKILKILYQIIIKDVSVLKIKIGLGQLFQKQIGKGLKKFLKSKTHHMQFNHWLINQCKQDIHQHCANIFPLSSQIQKKNKRSSFMKTFNSYIPRSKDNWFFYELRKISELIGFEIELSKQINFQQYLNGSYLKAIELDINGQESINEVYQRVVKHDCEEVFFYYLKLITELKVPLTRQGIQQQQQNGTILDLLNTMNRVTSLSVVKTFYKLILQNQIYIDQIKCVKVKHLFQSIHQKLIYYILTEGWSSFVNRSKIDLREQHCLEFSPDIFRDLECQILFFVAIRNLLGTKNNDCFRDDNQFMNKDIRRTQTKAACLWMRQSEDENQSEQLIDIVLDGQYIKLINQDSKSVSSENILINRAHIYESEEANRFEIIQKQNNQSPYQQYFCIQFLQTPIKNYIWKQIKWRKQIILEIQLKLKLMNFQFIQNVQI